MANPLGSTDPDDFLLNVAGLDNAINKHSSNEDPSHWTDRRGAERWTWWGFENRIATLISSGQADIDNLISTSQTAFNTFMTESETAFDTFMTGSQTAVDDLLTSGQAAFDDALAANQATFDQTMQNNEAEFQERMASMGYQPLGDYDADGPLTIEYSNEVFTKDGEFYRPAPTLELPYITVNDWTVDEANFLPIGDAALRSDLGGPGGVKLVNSADITFTSVTRMISATWLAEEDEVATTSYHSGYWGLGGNRYVIKAPSSSYVPDHGAVIELDNGLVAVGLFPKGIFASQWGIRDENTVSANTERLQAWADFVSSPPRAPGLVAPAQQGFLDVDLVIGDTIHLRDNGANSVPKWFMQGGYLAADADTFPAAEPMIAIGAAHSTVHDVRIAGHDVAGSILIDAAGVECHPARIQSCVSGIQRTGKSSVQISNLTRNAADQTTTYNQKQAIITDEQPITFADYREVCQVDMIAGDSIGNIIWDGANDLFRFNTGANIDTLLVGPANAQDVGIAYESNRLKFIAGDAHRLQLTDAGHLFPMVTSTQNLGTASATYKTIYVDNVVGPAVQADTVQDLTAVELRVGAALVPKRFQPVGSSKRHVGFFLPDVEAAFAAEGLDALQYGAVLEEEDEGGVLVKVVNHEQVAALALASRLAGA